MFASAAPWPVFLTRAPTWPCFFRRFKPNSFVTADLNFACFFAYKRENCRAVALSLAASSKE